MVSKGRPGSRPHRAHGSDEEDRCLNSPLTPSGIRTLLVGMQVARGPREASNPAGTVREDTDPETGRWRS